jgi:hypothetical protein
MNGRYKRKYLQATTAPPQSVPPSEHSTKTKESDLGIIGQFAGLSASLSLVCSVIYDYGYFNAIDVSFSEIPISINDHIRSSLLWLPFAVFSASAYLFLEIWSKRQPPKPDSTTRDTALTRNILTAYKKNKSLPAPLWLKVLSLCAMITIIAIFVYSEYIPWELRFLLTGFSFMLLWMHFAWWVIVHPRIMSLDKDRIQGRIFMYAPILIAALAGKGYGDARLAIRGASNTYNLTLKTREQKKFKVKILRNYEKFVFVNYSNNRTLILPQVEVLEAEKIRTEFTLKDAKTVIDKIPPKKLLNIMWNGMER